MRIRTTILTVFLLFTASCTTSRKEPKPLVEQEVIFGWSQVLLREVIAGLNEQVEGNVTIDPKLNEVANLAITFIPSSEVSAHASLAVALDYLRNYIAIEYEVPTRWKQNGDVITLFYDGSEAAYADLPKRD